MPLTAHMATVTMREAEHSGPTLLRQAPGTRERGRETSRKGARSCDGRAVRVVAVVRGMGKGSGGKGLGGKAPVAAREVGMHARVVDNRPVRGRIGAGRTAASTEIDTPVVETIVMTVMIMASASNSTIEEAYRVVNCALHDSLFHRIATDL
jgi:hypothetical protein